MKTLAASTTAWCSWRTTKSSAYSTIRGGWLTLIPSTVEPAGIAASSARSSPDNAMLASSGLRGPPCGVP